MTAVEELVDTLLWEGYALYPYTPDATKNATPTPFGIVYPPAYATGSPHTFDRLKLQCIATGTQAFSATVAFLEPSGERHEAVERRLELSAPGRVEFAFEAVRGTAELGTEDFDGLMRVTVAVHNETEVPEGLDRTAALRSSLLSTHVVVRAAGGRLLSPISPPEEFATAVMTCAQVNTFPVLAGDGEDTILGAAIMLPDHPQIAPESRGNLFDSTEIEEALLLHVLALSDGERAELANADPAVRAMVERAVSATPEDIMALHGRVTVTDPEPPPGEENVVVDGVTFRRGDGVRLSPAPGRNAQDHLLTGRTATIERILLDYDDAIHLAVTIDDDPGSDLMRDTGRFLYFKTDEVDLL